MWAMKMTTCLSLGLNPSDAAHMPVICNNCTLFWEKRLLYDISKYDKQKRSVRMTCERPFDCRDDAVEAKVEGRERLKSLFAAPGTVSAPSGGHWVMPVNGRIRGAETAGALPSSARSVNEVRKKRGPPKLFNANGVLSVELTNSIKGRLEGRNHLEYNEIDLITSLLSTYSRADLSGKNKLTSSEERLLGQLAVIAFRNMPDGKIISLPNFPRAKNIQLARLPRQYKEADEVQNKKLYKSRITTGRKWMNHLPGVFNDKVLATIFLQIEPEILKKTFKQFQKTQLRLGADDSSSIKSFVGLSDKQYVKFNRVVSYFTGLRLVAPIKTVRNLRLTRKKEDYTSMSRSVIDMSRVIKKGGTVIARQIKVGVVTIRPFECILNSTSSLLNSGGLLPSERRFRRQGNIPSNISDVIMWKFSADKGGGSWKLIVNPVNVEHPQSLRHVQPICEFTAPDSRENMAAAMFHEGSPCRQEMEDIMHRRCVLLYLKVGEQMEVALVKNTNTRHHRAKPHALPKEYQVRLHHNCEEGAATLEQRVAKVDFTLVKAILLMYNTTQQRFDKIKFEDERQQSLGELTLKRGIACGPHQTMQVTMVQYLLAGLFTGDLDFLANFFGHQGASAKWLCLFCLANQDQLGETFRLGGCGPRFPKRKGVNSLQQCFETYKREYLDLMLTMRTKAKKEQVTQEMSYSIVAAALADIPLDAVAPATMHVILGLTKKIYEWMLKLYRKLEELEENKTAGNTTYQFRQAIVETRDHAIEYGTFLKTKFNGAIDSIEGKRLESIRLMKEIEKVTARVMATR